ncbi:hypothetical protein K7472_13010 [Streptomyces sp. PTM05]|uniref:Uncharacterized protein n=1 Tax=Streptantibioticus parmotrematis TaxID=2873249 RepID=A0ABS7QTQ6_9ACTN|nr:hypothetical protein [Streptantibioticus parmotrematis]MBY8885765.1 hypothetical protein [Streptantibioticus parmotrematis]
MEDGTEKSGQGQPRSAPEVGAVVRDSVRERLGVLVEVDGPVAHVRPPEGGTPWLARLADVYAACPMDELRAKVAELNARRRFTP